MVRICLREALEGLTVVAFVVIPVIVMAAYFVVHVFEWMAGL